MVRCTRKTNRVKSGLSLAHRHPAPRWLPGAVGHTWQLVARTLIALKAGLLHATPAEVPTHATVQVPDTLRLRSATPLELLQVAPLGSSLTQVGN